MPSIPDLSYIFKVYATPFIPHFYMIIDFNFYI